MSVARAVRSRRSQKCARNSALTCGLRRQTRAECGEAGSITERPPHHHRAEMEVRRRASISRKNSQGKAPRYVPDPGDYDDSIPYGGKVRLAKRKKPDGWVVTTVEVLSVCAGLFLLYYAVYYFDHLHFGVTHLYAHLGHAHSQHAIGHRYLKGDGVEVNHTMAFHWFRKAADQGHPHSAYNLAVGHLQGYETDVQPGEAHSLLEYARKEGVEEAEDVFQRVCTKGHCKY